MRQTTFEELPDDEEIDDLFSCDTPDDDHDPWESSNNNRPTGNQISSQLQYPNSDDEQHLQVTKSSSVGNSYRNQSHMAGDFGRSLTSQKNVSLVSAELDVENAAASERAEQRLMAIVRQVSFQHLSLLVVLHLKGKDNTYMCLHICALKADMF